MTRRTWRRLTAAAAVATALMVPTAALADSAAPSAAGSATGSAASKPPATTMTVGFLEDFDSLNPYVGILSTSFEVWGAVYDQLVGYSQKDFTPTPELAESWKESPDHTTWTYKIRKGIKWSDGQPLTAADAAYTFNRIINSGPDDIERVNYGNYVTNLTKAEAPDATTLVLTVSAPSPIMTHLAVPILPEHIWKNISEKQVSTFKNEPIVGSGPFVFDQHVIGQFVAMHANPNYWGGAPKIHSLVFRVFQSEDTMVAAIKKGEIDVADGLQSTSFESLKGKSGVTALAAEYSTFHEIGFNTGAATNKGDPIGDGHPALKDKRVRQAIQYAIDRKTLVDKVLGGYGTQATSIMPPLYAAYHYDPGADTRNQDFAKANQILDDAGYARGPDGIRVMPGTGRKLSFRLFGRADYPPSKDVVQYVQGWLKNIGIDVTVQITSNDKVNEIIANGEYDMFEYDWGVEPDPDYQLSTFLCSSRSTKDGSTISAGLSDSFYCNPAYDALYQQQSQTTDEKARADIVKQMEKMLYEDTPYALTYYDADLEAYRSDRFTNMQQQPEGKGVMVFQYGTYTYRLAEPVSSATSTSTSSSTGLWAGVGVFVLLVLALGGFMFMRSRRSVDDRE